MTGSAGRRPIVREVLDAASLPHRTSRSALRNSRRRRRSMRRCERFLGPIGIDRAKLSPPW
ncbi:MAG TPA: hypothetical protein DCQ98_11550 [Planctomycetaceae bacterium]|nr:hypothetical protein [Planctomycetaceae bacterium]